MITVRCELSDEDLYSVVDDAFINGANMKKINVGTYEGEGSEIFHSSYEAINTLIRTRGFIDAVKIFTRDVGGEEEDILEYYEYLVEKGEL